MTQIDIDEWEGPDSHGTRIKKTWQPWQIFLAVVAISAGIAFAAWAAFGDPDNAVSANEISFTVNSPEQTTLIFEVTKPTDITVSCSVEALAHNYLQVGFQEIVLGPAATSNQSVTATIATSEAAVTAIVKGCFVVD